MQNKINIMLQEDGQQIKMKTLELRTERLALETAIQNSEFKTTELNTKYDRETKDREKKLEQEMAGMETELNKEALDEQILRYRAYEKVQNCMYNRTVNTQTQQVDKDDFVANLAQSWFLQKEASRPQ